MTERPDMVQLAIEAAAQASAPHIQQAAMLRAQLAVEQWEKTQLEERVAELENRVAELTEGAA